MENTTSENKPTLWKRFEKIFGLVGFLAGIAALIGLYYQIQTKKTEVQFQLISKDYLTLNNNVDGLKSNYSYNGTPVNNLWLIKFRLINSGDVTLIGNQGSENILDSNIIFRFQNDIKILGKITIEQNNFPEHQLIQNDSNAIALSFSQWRKAESATYSIYVKSNLSNLSFIPKVKRVIKDGDILVLDYSNNQNKIKQPLIDKYVPYPWSLVGRILGIILSLSIFLFITWGVLLEYKYWFKLRKWKKKNYEKFKNFITSSQFINTQSNFDYLFTKDNFLLKKDIYLKKPIEIPRYSKFWDVFSGEKIPEDIYDHSMFSWKDFWLFTLLLLSVDISVIFIILGLWIR